MFFAVIEFYQTADQFYASHRKMSILLLPREVLYHIFQYLPISDRKAVALTCRSMYASFVNGYGCWSRRSPRGGRRRRLITVTMTTEDVTNGFEALRCAQQLGVRRIRFVSASLQREQLRSSWNEFWDSLGSGIWELSFHACDISERTFCDILLDLCPNLESLTLDNCNSLFMSGKLLDAAERPTSSLQSIRELNLNNNRYLSDALFNRLTSFTTNVTRLSLEGCQISFHPAVYKRFYPPNAPASESVLTFQNVLEFLQVQSAKIVSLDFSNTLVDDCALKKLCTLEDMHLEELFLFNCQQVSVLGIETICCHHPRLQILDLAKCARLTDRAVIAISRCLKQLTHLDVRMCGNLTADGIAELGKLMDVSRVDQSECESLHSQRPFFTVNNSNASAMHLVKLNLSSCNLTEDTVIALSRSLSSSLRYLDLSNCQKGVTDISLQSICANLRWLRCLKLAWCNAITDAVLVGGGGLSSSSQENGVTSPRLCDIRGLRKLDLCACTEITDAGFRKIRFRELVVLTVSLCHRLSDVGLVSIGAYCNGNVEKLVLSQCRDITDIGVVAVVKCLPRLKYLDLQGCKKIGPPTMAALKHWCCELRYLDVSMCPYITLESIYLLESVLSRLHVNRRHIQPDRMIDFEQHNFRF